MVELLISAAKNYTKTQAGWEEIEHCIMNEWESVVTYYHDRVSNNTAIYSYLSQHGRPSNLRDKQLLRHHRIWHRTQPVGRNTNEHCFALLLPTSGFVNFMPCIFYYSVCTFIFVHMTISSDGIDTLYFAE